MSPLLDVPDWLKNHPDLLAREIKLHQAIKPYGSLYYTPRPYGAPIPQYVVKVLDSATEECSINQRLQDNVSSPNHSLPCEVIPSEPRLLVMPYVGGLGIINFKNRPTSFFLDVYHQIIEGVEYLHRRRIAHLDICFDNVACAKRYHAATDVRLVEGKVYLIDFHTSQQLTLGPGHQSPIVLPPSQEEKPLGVTTLDPYSFDVYCAGKLMQEILKYTALKEPDFPWMPRRFAQWLVGKERGCTSYYTNDLSAWQDPAARLRYVETDPEDGPTVVQLARLTDTLSLLPTAYLTCVALSADCWVLPGGPVVYPVADLSLLDLALVIDAKGYLTRACAKRVLLLLSTVPSPRCASREVCAIAREEPLVALQENGDVVLPVDDGDAFEPIAERLGREPHWGATAGKPS